jgi:hypothetical protein
MDAPRSIRDAFAVEKDQQKISPIRFPEAFTGLITVGRAKRIISYTWVPEHFY